MTEFNLTTVDFHGDTIYATQLPDGIFVALKPISDRLGLAWGSQWNRIQRDPILKEAVVTMKMAFAGNGQETTLMRYDMVHGWLFGVDVQRVNPKYQADILTYKRECYRVLCEHFSKAKLAAPGEETELALSLRDKMALVALFIRMGGPRAGAQKAIALGIKSVPALDAALAQQAFSFVVDLDTSGPASADTVN